MVSNDIHTDDIKWIPELLATSWWNLNLLQRTSSVLISLMRSDQVVNNHWLCKHRHCTCKTFRAIWFEWHRSIETKRRVAVLGIALTYRHFCGSSSWLMVLLSTLLAATSANCMSKFRFEINTLTRQKHREKWRTFHFRTSNALNGSTMPLCDTQCV